MLWLLNWKNENNVLKDKWFDHMLLSKWVNGTSNNIIFSYRRSIFIVMTNHNFKLLKVALKIMKAIS